MSDVMMRLKPARVDPEELAVQALNYLSIDQERLLRFLQHTGIEPAAIRQAAEMPGFLLGVMDYIVAHEWLVIGLAEHAGVRPEAVTAAREALAPRSEFD